MCMVEDAQPWEIQASYLRKARTTHRCGECWRTIQSGEEYHHVTGRFEGRWVAHSWCRHCDAAARWLNEECGGWCYGKVLEDLVEHWVDDPLNRSVWLARAIAGMRRKWCGGRMDVPSEPPVLAVTG